MRLVIEDKGNTSFKLTITQDDEVRIKLQSGIDKKTQDEMVEKIKSIANVLIDDDVNTQTLRGKFKYGDVFMPLYIGSKKFVKKVLLNYHE